MNPLVESLLNVVLGIAELAVLIAIVALARRRMPDMRQIAIVLGVLLAAHVVLMLGTIPKTPLSWNWLGKLFSIAVTIGALAVIPSLSWTDAGFTWRQNGAAGRAAIAAVLVCLFAWGANVLIAGLQVKHPDLETILYEATMPGFNEEPLYRGVALVLLDRALWNERWSFAGAPIGWGAILTSVWFGLIHGNGIGNGHFQIDPVTIGIVAVIGLGLAWIRMRTGSLAIGIVAHNLLNVGQEFI